LAFEPEKRIAGPGPRDPMAVPRKNAARIDGAVLCAWMVPAYFG